ncbi:MAG: hypothetical protein M1812_007577 [Candelaria pacifica]|nr:MAG: hypothetical protein M1812_007577 [Candelaria pacifica]
MGVLYSIHHLQTAFATQNGARSTQFLSRRRIALSSYTLNTNSEISPRGDTPGPPLLDSTYPPLDTSQTTSSTVVSNTGTSRDYLLPVIFFLAFFIICVVVASLLVLAICRARRGRKRNPIAKTYELQRGTLRYNQSLPQFGRLENFIHSGGAVGARRENDVGALRREAARRAQGLRKSSTPRSSRQPSLAPSILATPPGATRSVMSFERLSSTDSELLLPPPVYKADDPLQKRGSGSRLEKLPSYQEEE